MSRWTEYMMNPTSLETSSRPNRSRGDATGATHHFSLLQGGQRSSHLNQRGFVSPRSIMRMSSSVDYDAMDDFPSDPLSSSILPGGYLAPGTHAVPTSLSMPMSMSRSMPRVSSGPPSCTYGGRRPTPRPSNHSMRPGGPPGFGSRLGYGQSRNLSHSHTNYPPYNTYQSRARGPIFTQHDDDEDDAFLPSETLPPIDEVYYSREDGIEEDDEGMDYLGSSGFPQLHDNRSRERFEERLASFPEVPLEAHRRIFLMGNEIVDCYEVRLDRYFHGTMLDSVPDCIAVFTKKERTGQRWLMVFKEDVTRTVVKFNRLLTHSLMVRIMSPTAIEVEAAKSYHGPPTEMCILNFVNREDGSRFYKMLQEGQTTAWNHREVTHEQRMKTVFSKINHALADMDLMDDMTQDGQGSIGIASGSGGSSGDNGNRVRIMSGSSSGEIPPSRSPFTFSFRNRAEDRRGQDGGGNEGIMPHPSQSAPMLKKSLRAVSRSPVGAGSSSSAEHFQSQPQQPGRPHRIADLDDDWRSTSRGRRGSGDNRDSRDYLEELVQGPTNTTREQVRERPRSTTTSLQNRLLRKSSNKGPGINLRLGGDGSGDCYNNVGKVNVKPTMPAASEGNTTMKMRQGPETTLTIPGDVIFQGIVTVFVKLEPGDYAELGTGTLQLLDHRDIALNELRLLDGDKREILQQYIYKWNSALKRSSDEENKNKKKCPVCIWDGAVCFPLEPDAVPERRDFKMRLSSEEDADGFVSSFMQSVEKARDESIRKRHICWYLQNKRDYKRINNNNNPGGNSQQF